MGEGWKRRRAFAALWWGEAVSSLGGAFGTLANAWFLYDRTGSEAAMGALMLTYFLPSLLVQLAAGPFLDRWRKSLVLCGSQWVRAAAYLLLAAASVGGAQVWLLFPVTLVAGVAQALYAPAALAFLPEIQSGDSLTRANARIDGTARLMSFLGPIAGGWLTAAAGPAAVWWTVGFLYAGSGALLLLLKEGEGKPAQKGKGESWIHEIAGGFRFLSRRRPLLWLAFFLCAVQFAVGALLVLQAPYMAGELGGSETDLGWFAAGFPLGYAAGSSLCAKGVGTASRRWMLGANVLGGCTFLALALNHQLGWAVAIEVCAGLVAPFFHIHSTTLFQRLVPAPMRGRVFSLRLFLIRCALPLGSACGGWAGEAWGVRPALAVIGTLLAGISLAGMVLPWFRFLDEGAGEAASEGNGIVIVEKKTGEKRGMM